MNAALDAGLTAIRTWGFNDKNSTFDPNGMPKYNDIQEAFQVWTDGTPAINLAPFDKVMDAADATGMKLIITLTNNWADYGGMDMYTVNLGGTYHDDVSSVLVLIL